MPAENQALFDAINAAVSGEAPASADISTETNTDDNGNESGDVQTEGDDTGAGEGSSDTPAGGNSAGDGSSGEEADESGDDTASEADGEGEGDGAAGSGRDGNKGADKPKGDEGKTPEIGPDGKPKPVEAKKPDPLNDPFDKRWKDSTTKRVQSLVDMVKARDATIENSNVLIDSIADTGMSPEELSVMLQYSFARHKGTPEQKQQALTFLKKELRELALEVGDEEIDFLEEHQDLKDAVAANQITEQHARELAIARSRGTRAAARETAANGARTAQEEHTAGVNGVNAVASKLAKRDGDAAFLAKKNVLVAALKPVFARLAPKEWATAFEQAYEALPKAKPAAAPTPKPKPNEQPLRPATPAGGGGSREAKSMREAVFMAIDGDAD